MHLHILTHMLLDSIIIDLFYGTLACLSLVLYILWPVFGEDPQICGSEPCRTVKLLTVLVLQFHCLFIKPGQNVCFDDKNILQLTFTIFLKISCLFPIFPLKILIFSNFDPNFPFGTPN